MTLTLQEAKDLVYKKHFEKNGEMWMPTRFQYGKMDNEAAEIYAESKAKEFAEWILIEGFEKYQENGKCWWGRFNEEKDYSTEKLYEIFNLTNTPNG